MRTLIPAQLCYRSEGPVSVQANALVLFLEAVQRGVSLCVADLRQHGFLRLGSLAVRIQAKRFRHDGSRTREDSAGRRSLVFRLSLDIKYVLSLMKAVGELGLRAFDALVCDFKASAVVGEFQHVSQGTLSFSGSSTKASSVALPGDSSPFQSHSQIPPPRLIGSASSRGAA